MALAIVLDLLVGEPPSWAHPTVWMGRLAEALRARIRPGRPSAELFQGVLLWGAVVIPFSGATYLGLRLLGEYLGAVAFAIVAVVLLKCTIAIRSMQTFTIPIAESAANGDYGEARRLLRNVVRRDPAQLTEQQVLSAAVETIAEGTVDGVTGPIFLYSLLGVPGAVAYRAINTLDSTVGYRDRANIHVGWFSAKLDTAANYVPARLTGLLTVLSAFIMRLDWMNSYRVLRRDHSVPESLNAGWSMSAVAGALGVKLEKPGAYSLGDAKHALDASDVGRALGVMRLNVLLFSLVVAVPVLAAVWLVTSVV